MKTLLLVLIFSLSFVGIAYAQEATAEATEVVVVPVEEVVDTAVVTDEQFTVATLLDFGKWAGTIAAALFTISKVLGLAKEWLALKKKDVAFMSKGEGAAAWTPSAIKSSFRQVLNDGIEVGKSALEIFDEWVDNEPYAAKVAVTNMTKKPADTKELPPLE